MFDPLHFGTIFDRSTRRRGYLNAGMESPRSGGRLGPPPPGKGQRIQRPRRFIAPVIAIADRRFVARIDACYGFRDSRYFFVKVEL